MKNLFIFQFLLFDNIYNKKEKIEILIKSFTHNINISISVSISVSESIPTLILIIRNGWWCFFSFLFTS